MKGIFTRSRSKTCGESLRHFGTGLTIIGMFLAVGGSMSKKIEKIRDEITEIKVILAQIKIESERSDRSVKRCREDERTQN